MNEVSQKSQNKILEKIKPEELYDELINTVYKEKLRISKNHGRQIQQMIKNFGIH